MVTFLYRAMHLPAPVEPEPALADINAMLLRGPSKRGIDTLPKQTVTVSSTKELQDYLESVYEMEYFEGIAPDKYTDAYFVNNVLLLAPVKVCGSSPGFSIEPVTEKENTIEVKLTKPGQPESPDMCAWVVLIKAAKTMSDREVVIDIHIPLGPDQFFKHSAHSVDELIEWTRAELAEPSEEGQNFAHYLSDAEKNRGILVAQPATEEFAPWTIAVRSEDSVVGFYFTDSQNDNEFEIYIDQSDTSLEDVMGPLIQFYSDYFTDWELTKTTVKVGGVDTEIYSWGGMEYTEREYGSKEPDYPTAYFEYMGHVVKVLVWKGLDKTKWDDKWLELFTFERKDLT